ncbi:Uncharacterised protein [Pandoraea pulmonicola]|uniref:Uncharacterized protein n=1 Tax=Pandoraea pulmonicola TaxID=93221 RepID=A0AAJ4ZB02_PANPU|nr:Uncharacterised protein [Pandoraea pulmonicola]
MNLSLPAQSNRCAPSRAAVVIDADHQRNVKKVLREISREILRLGQQLRAALLRVDVCASFELESQSQGDTSCPTESCAIHFCHSIKYLKRNDSHITARSGDAGLAAGQFGASWTEQFSGLMTPLILFPSPAQAATTLCTSGVMAGENTARVLLSGEPRLRPSSMSFSRAASRCSSAMLSTSDAQRFGASVQTSRPAVAAFEARPADVPFAPCFWREGCSSGAA